MRPWRCEGQAGSTAEADAAFVGSKEYGKGGDHVSQ